MGTFTTPYDVANVGLQLLGIPRITAFTDASSQAKETGFSYDKARRSELRRFVWTFATRRAVLRKATSTMKPVVFPVWSAATTYAVGDLVSYLGQIFESTAASNLNNAPNTTAGMSFWDTYAGAIYADAWSASVTYYPGDIVYVTSTVYRLSSITTSLNNAPASGAPWIAPTSLTLGSAVTFRSPAGFDTPSGSTQRNVYFLPANFLRLAPQDPKQAAVARLGTTAGLLYNDWEIEYGALYTVATTDPLIFRFVADTTLVPYFDDMFCHAVGARIALDLNERMTQRQDLAQKAMAEYSRFIAEARAVSAIEMGSTEEDILIGAPQQQPNQQQAGAGRGGV